MEHRGGDTGEPEGRKAKMAANLLKLHAPLHMVLSAIALPLPTVKPSPINP
jgi:hypothetical protein